MSATVFHVGDVIGRKRDGQALTADQIGNLVRAVVERKVSDAQTAAFLMATFLRGLDGEELRALTAAMRFSGEVLQREDGDAGVRVDKHSTGGVGDKTSLLIAPIIAAVGLESRPPVSIPMISGRGLGHTGGTLDKLETIPGFRTQMSLGEIAAMLRSAHAALAGQTPELVPADRILYALRDHTATVASPYLICASIMSKKLAEDLDALVLDVKTGSGAFLPKEEDARTLAELMVRTGEASGTRTVALLTTMDQPLGQFAGNWLEVWECVAVLKGEAHAMSADMVELSLLLCGHMLQMAGVVETVEAGVTLAGETVRSGKAYRSWLQIVEAQGGDVRVFADPAAFHRPAACLVLRAWEHGYVSGMDCTAVGWAVQRLGAGRLAPGEPVSAHAGLEMHRKLGDEVRAGEPLVTLFAEDAALLPEAERMLREAIRLGAERPALAPLVRAVISAATLGTTVGTTR